MPDSILPPGGERRSPSTRLPIFSTEPLNAAERDVLRQLARALRIAADGVDDALQRGRVEHGLEACQTVGTLAIVGQTVASALGRRR